MSHQIVVGGSKGIGAAIVRRLRQKGHKVEIWSRSYPDWIEKYESNFQEYLVWKKIDLADFDKLTNLDIESSVDTVYNCASCGVYIEDTDDFSTSSFQDIVNTNLIGGANVLFKSLNKLHAGSRLVHISSLTARVASGHWCLYGATKAALEHIIYSLRPLAEKRDISITLCYPGLVATSFYEMAGVPTPQQAVDANDIAPLLIDAAERRDRTFVAPMDEDFLQKISKLCPEDASRVSPLSFT